MRTRLAALALALIALCPAPAAAQWYFTGYFGANNTRPATVSIDQPPRSLALDFLDVEFEARSFAAPQYYGYRAGRYFGARRRVGLEFEFIHIKVIAKTDRAYEYRDRSGLFDPAPGPVLMRQVVERYAMSHGLNFLLVNAVARQPVGSRAALSARLGAGPTLPHAESTVGGLVQEQYEYAGMGGHAAAGIELRVKGPLSAMLEYKATYARPRITIAQGTGRTTTLSHHVAFGFTIGAAR